MSHVTATVTRVEVLDAVHAAFERGHHPRRDELISAAVSVGARREVTSLLERLPGARLSSPGELWNHLPEVPLGD